MSQLILQITLIRPTRRIKKIKKEWFIYKEYTRRDYRSVATDVKVLITEYNRNGKETINF
jgi:hypothetical protein